MRWELAKTNWPAFWASIEPRWYGWSRAPHHSAGDLIPGGRGLRKLRVPLPGRGKRGGARVIDYHWVSKEQCYLIYAYAKNVAANLTQEQLHRLADVIDVEVKNG